MGAGMAHQMAGDKKYDNLRCYGFGAGGLIRHIVLLGFNEQHLVHAANEA